MRCVPPLSGTDPRFFLGEQGGVPRWTSHPPRAINNARDTRNSRSSKKRTSCLNYPQIYDSALFAMTIPFRAANAWGSRTSHGGVPEEDLSWALQNPGFSFSVA